MHLPTTVPSLQLIVEQAPRTTWVVHQQFAAHQVDALGAALRSDSDLRITSRSGAVLAGLAERELDSYSASQTAEPSLVGCRFGCRPATNPGNLSAVATRVSGTGS